MAAPKKTAVVDGEEVELIEAPEGEVVDSPQMTPAAGVRPYRVETFSADGGIGFRICDALGVTIEESGADFDSIIEALAHATSSPNALGASIAR